MASEVNAWYQKYMSIEPYRKEEYGETTYGQFVFKVLEDAAEEMAVQTRDVAGELRQYNRDEICLVDNETQQKQYIPWSSIYAFAKVKV